MNKKRPELAHLKNVKWFYLEIGQRAKADRALCDYGNLFVLVKVKEPQGRLFDLNDETLAKECIKKTKDLYTLCIQKSGKNKR